MMARMKGRKGNASMSGMSLSAVPASLITCVACRICFCFRQSMKRSTQKAMPETIQTIVQIQRSSDGASGMPRKPVMLLEPRLSSATSRSEVEVICPDLLRPTTVSKASRERKPKTVMKTSGSAQYLRKATQVAEKTTESRPPHTHTTKRQANRSLMYWVSVAMLPDTASPMTLSGISFSVMMDSTYLCVSAGQLTFPGTG